MPNWILERAAWAGALLARGNQISKCGEVSAAKA